jgi:hypothetical protein
MQPAVFRDDILAAIGGDEGIERVDRIDADGADHKAGCIGVAHPLGLQLFLHRLEEINKSIPGFREVRNLITCLFDQRPPNMEWRCRRFHRY